MRGSPRSTRSPSGYEYLVAHLDGELAAECRGCLGARMLSISYELVVALGVVIAKRVRS